MNPPNIQSNPIGIRDTDDPGEELDLFDRGLAFDVATLMSRRQLIRLIGYTGMDAGALTIAACVPGAQSSASPASSATAGAIAATASAAATASSAASSRPSS